MVKKEEKISVVIFTKNEEQNIGDCIESVKSLADEVIVIDMKSKDNTVKIAKKYNVKIYIVKDYKWVEPVRNFGISKAKYGWVLILDADERVSVTLAKKLIEIAKDDKFDAVKIPFKVIFFNKWIKHTYWWPDYHIRFFRKGFVKWVVKIHPDIEVSGRVLELPSEEKYSVTHENARNIKIWLKKIDHHTDYEDYFFRLKTVRLSDIVGRFKREFYWRYFESRGYLDGMHGFVLSKFMEYYRFLEFAKYWEKKGYPELVPAKELKAAMESEGSFVDERIRHLEEKNKSLRAQLNDITSSKTYKYWQKYCQLRDWFKKIVKN